MKRFLIIQTAFLGDLILTLPLLDVLKQRFSDSLIDIVVIPSTSQLLKNNPLINDVIVYDKRITGFSGLNEIARRLRSNKYDTLISPHRSARSALISKLAKAGESISFDRSALSFLYDKTVSYEDGIHEIQRNLRLLLPIGIDERKIINPRMFPGEEDIAVVDQFIEENELQARRFAAIAPGAVWFTKKFPEEKFINVIGSLNEAGITAVIVGGSDDEALCNMIVSNAGSAHAINVAGKFSILQSSELIRRSSLLICNDSAPLHIGNAVGTPVFAVFGSTIPGFGFYPYGQNDLVFEISGLKCKPCGIHGRKQCPLGTLECMHSIDETKIANEAIKLLGKA